MNIGITLMLSDQTITVNEAAPAVEERGFESFWVGEHTHCPVGTVHSYTQGRYGTGTVTKDGYLPDFYKRFPDPYITLTAAAMCTSTVRIGTCIALPAEHSPLILAKVIATLDVISGGRFEFGIGYGWNPLELQNAGFEKHQRRQVLQEKIAAMKALWTQETAGFDGEFVQFSESWSYPKPVQKPHPPVLIGAAPTPGNVRDIVDWADGWIPVRVFMGDDKLVADVQHVRRQVEEAGRDPEQLKITVVDTSGAMGGKRSREAFVAHLPSRETLETYRTLGIHRLNLGAPVHDRSFYLWSLDRLAELQETLVA